MSHSAFLWTSLSKDHLMKKGKRPTTESIKHSNDKPLERKLRSYTRKISFFEKNTSQLQCFYPRIIFAIQCSLVVHDLVPFECLELLGLTQIYVHAQINVRSVLHPSPTINIDLFDYQYYTVKWHSQLFNVRTYTLSIPLYLLYLLFLKFNNV